MLKVASGSLRDLGYVILQPGSFMDPEIEKKICLMALPHTGNRPFDQWTIVSDGWWQLNFWEWKIKRFFRVLVSDIHALIPQENEFALEGLFFRTATEVEPIEDPWHIDAAYLIFLYILEGDGTYLVDYGLPGEKPRLVSIPERSAAIITGWYREEATGIPSILHSAPRIFTKPRKILIAVLQETGFSHAKYLKSRPDGFNMLNRKQDERVKVFSHILHR